MHDSVGNALHAVVQLKVMLMFFGSWAGTAHKMNRGRERGPEQPTK